MELTTVGSTWVPSNIVMDTAFTIDSRAGVHGGLLIRFYNNRVRIISKIQLIHKCAVDMLINFQGIENCLCIYYNIYE